MSGGASPQEDRFFVGVNLPWLTYGCDFGANAWQPGGGVGTPDQRARLDAIFARLGARGLRQVRWFVLCDGRAGLVVDSRGVPRGPDAFVIRDLDAAVAAAARHHLLLTLVLVDFRWCARRRWVNGVATGGRRRLIADPSCRAALLERVLRPLLQKCGTDPAVVAWDLFNEPEWATLGYGSLNPFTSLLPSRMRQVLREVAALVHAETRQRVTVGLASLRGLGLLRGVDVDLYQAHWYDRRSREPGALKGGWRDKPVLLGEFPTSRSLLPPEEVVRLAKARGYRGAFGWSALAGDEHSELAALERAVEGDDDSPPGGPGASG